MSRVPFQSYTTVFTCQPLASDNSHTSWSVDLNIEIETEVWQSVLKCVHTPSICARHGVLQCKVHWFKSKLACIYPGTDLNCDKCHLGPANLTHMFWTCPVFDSLSAITCANIQPSPLVVLFGVLPTDHSLTSYFAELVAFLTLLARRLILMHSESSSPPHTHWIKDALSFVKLEKN